MAVQTDFTREQELLRDVVARALRDKSSTNAVRELMESERGYDPAVWQELLSDAGFAGVHVAEAYGGVGGGAVELGIVAEEMGRTLFCGPFLASVVMAGSALQEAADETARAELLPDIASAATIATLVLDDLNSPAGVGRSIRATAQGRLSGTAAIVIDGHIADLLFVVAATEAGLGLHAVDQGAAGLSVEPLEAVDPTRKLSRVTLSDVPGRFIG